jgi:hypothetical protein
MSLTQIAVSDWSIVFVTVLGRLLIIIFMVTMQRGLSHLRADLKQLSDAVKLLSDDVSGLKIAEETRFMGEINARRKTADHIEPPQAAAPSLRLRVLRASQSTTP